MKKDTTTNTSPPSAAPPPSFSEPHAPQPPTTTIAGPISNCRCCQCRQTQPSTIAITGYWNLLSLADATIWAIKTFFYRSEEDKVAIGTNHRFEEETCFLEYDVNIFCSNVFSVGSGWYTNYWLRTAKDLGKKE